MSHLWVVFCSVLLCSISVKALSEFGQENVEIFLTAESGTDDGGAGSETTVESLDSSSEGSSGETGTATLGSSDPEWNVDEAGVIIIHTCGCECTDALCWLPGGVCEGCDFCSTESVLVQDDCPDTATPYVPLLGVFK